MLERATCKVVEAGSPKPATIGVEWPPDVAEAENCFSSRFDSPNDRVNQTCVVEPSTWHALPAMLLVERSAFGLYALLGRAALSSNRNRPRWGLRLLTQDRIRES